MLCPLSQSSINWRIKYTASDSLLKYFLSATACLAPLSEKGLGILGGGGGGGMYVPGWHPRIGPTGIVSQNQINKGKF